MRYQTAFGIVGAVVIAGFLCAVHTACANQSNSPASTQKMVNNSVKTGLLYLADTSISTDKQESGWRKTLRKSLFPDTGSSYISNELTAMALIPDLKASPYDNNGSLFMADRERNRLAVKARGEAYRVTAEMILALRPIAKLKEAIEPFIRPLEVYKGESGDITTKYFGAGDTHQKNSVKVFSLNFGVSASNSINMGMAFYKTVELAFFDGNKVELNYAPSGSSHKIGIREKGLDQVLLVYGFRF